MKKKILWLQNVVIPQIGKQIGLEKNYGGGWLASLFDCFCNISEIELAIVAPIPMRQKSVRGKKICKARFYSFYEKRVEKYDEKLEDDFRSIILDFEPDIVHIFGTEFPHTLAMVKAFNKPERTMIHIQGLVSVYARHYYANLPFSVVRRNTFRDLVRLDNIVCQKKKFELRGNYEKESLRQVNHAMGRTDWDKACVTWLNPRIQYHEVQEMMRREFYEGCWNVGECEKYSIFISQGHYPIKGLHFILEALKLLRVKYPTVKLYIAGSDIIHFNGIKQRVLQQSYYAKYICTLIEKWNLKNHVFFLGSLNAKEMKERYLSSHVFVSASAIENSPNSIGEAMLLGVPIVASDVGGVPSLISHQENGLLYQFDEPHMLAYYVSYIFRNVNFANEISKNEVACASLKYDKETILRNLLEIYESLCG